MSRLSRAALPMSLAVSLSLAVGSAAQTAPAGTFNGITTGPYSGMLLVIRPDGLYQSQQRFSLYRWHITDPVRFEKELRVTIQSFGWRSGDRYLPLQDDIASVAYW